MRRRKKLYGNDRRHVAWPCREILQNHRVVPGVNRSTKCGRGGQESGHPACKHQETKRERDERWRLPTAATAASRTTAAEHTTAADSPAEPTLWNDTVSVGDVEIAEPMWAVKSAPVKVR